MSSKQRRKAADAPSTYQQYQQKRRQQALVRQKTARHEKVQEVRSLAQAAVAEDDAATGMAEDLPQRGKNSSRGQHASNAGGPVAAAAVEAGSDQQQLYGMAGVDPSSLSGAALRSYFAKQLMSPEWMTDIPADLASAWLVMPRPEGVRCLVISSGGSTVSRSRTGGLLHRFHSRLPGGGPCSNSGSFCVLDCIFQQHHLPQLPHEQLPPPPQQQLQRLEGGQGQQQQQQQQAVVAGMDEDMAACATAGARGSSGGSSGGRGGAGGSGSSGGGRSSHGHSGGSSSSSSGTYYIQDVLAWRGYSLVDCAADFRLFWLRSKLEEEEGVAVAVAEGGSGSNGSNGSSSSSWRLDGGGPIPGHPCRFQLLPSWPSDPAGLQAAATAGSTSPAATGRATAAVPPPAAAAVPPTAAAAAATPNGSSSSSSSSFTQDGLYLRHSEGHYVLGGGSTPLALLWKDESCSRYLLDTDAEGVVPQHQQVVLRYQGPDQGSGVATGDEPPVVLGRLPHEFVGAMGPALLRPGRLLRFSIRGGGLLFSPADGAPCGADLAYEGPANQRRGRPDQLSKIVFQWQARRAPVRLAQLLQQAAAGAATAGGGAGQQAALGLAAVGAALLGAEGTSAASGGAGAADMQG